MSIKIGDNNKIKNSSIGHGNDKTSPPQENFFSRHPFFSYLIIPMLIAFTFLFDFWKIPINWIENLFS